MEPTAFITGADRGLGLALASGLLERGWRVFAGQYLPEWPELAALAGRHPQALQTQNLRTQNLRIVPLDVGSLDSAQEAARCVAGQTDSLDLLINNAGVISSVMSRTIREDPDYAEMHRLYDVNALGPLRAVQVFLPLLDQGSLKRLCFVSSEASSIARSHRKAWFDYCMSKAALNMGVSILFNHLRPEGYTFRLYHPGWVRSYMSGKKNLEADLEPEEAAARALPIFLGAREDEDRLVLVDYLGKEWPW